ncbi:hypothetical protein BC833DRAFT_645684 [Globomyces pollinis-pini]|nr:hypothetical protein BC833DRAFT_645684 [Globomyces pollinis-pini]
MDPMKMENEKKDLLEERLELDGSNESEYFQLIDEILGHSDGQNCFQMLKDEVQFHEMHHQGGLIPRLIAVQGSITDGVSPIYRHPTDHLLEAVSWTPMVNKIRNQLQKSLNQDFNHCLIQYYRGGHDFISEHSDKTIDIVPNTNIVNFSAGATRTMVLRTKKGYTPSNTREKHTFQLSNNSAFVLTGKGNATFLHSIKQDKRMESLKSPEEIAFNGERISLTFRTIGTFSFYEDGVMKIYGQGATSKDKINAKLVNNSSEQVIAMLKAFSKENHEFDFDRNLFYGVGFDSTHCTENTI